MNNLEKFKQVIWEYYTYNRREFAWRNTQNPYHILVSEIMLQQTQTFRVTGKYEKFIGAFPNFNSLAQASTQDLLLYWQGLGYNYRALLLRNIAQKIVGGFHGLLPDNPEILKTYRGIGPNTAGSICAFAFNKPVVFIETNIRAVFIYHFFQHKITIHDKEIMPLIQTTLDLINPREWYYALMDYGVMIKKKFKNPAKKSKHYTKQSKFEGSDRQIRGKILQLLIQKISAAITLNNLVITLSADYERIEKIVQQLQDEQFIIIKDKLISLK